MDSCAPKLQLVSPYTHLVGHYWPYTVDFISAMTAKSILVSVCATQAPRETGLFAEEQMTWESCCHWTKWLLSINHRNRNWGDRKDAILRNIEFYICLKAAIHNAGIGGNAHIHCIESRHRILLNAVVHSLQTFSTLCVGAPDVRMDKARVLNYKKAFATGRLDFIVETEAVRKAWEPMAGGHVIHIPAAVPLRESVVTDRVATRKKLGLPLDACICLFFGTHREGKDYRTAISAAKKSKSQPFLLFVGPLISQNDPACLLKEMDYNHAASWNQYYPDDQVGDLFDACDAVILPYNKGYDKGSAVLLQACQYGKPVIATDTGHLAEFVNKHGTGFLFPPGNIQGLADCFDALSVADESRLIDLKTSIANTQKYYSWRALTKSYLDIFKLNR